ncbi:hypothetical protein ACFVHW_04170 [Streptomyces sp. NPDC127110]|uniref:hypothetical protein n=1 Tax=Streptomyces sp. NPDC127110 TaxID=3345362 RepID=UPI0036414F73
MTDKPSKSELWQALNDRQRLYLKAAFEEDQRAEARAGLDPRPAAEWRWLMYSIKAPKNLVGRSTIQYVVERQGQLDTGAGSSLAALRRRGLLEVRPTVVLLARLGAVDAVEVQLTRLGRAVTRAGLGIPPTTKIPTGLISRDYLWDAMAWLYEAGEEGFTHEYSRRDQPPEQTRFRPSWNTLLKLRDRRDGSLWEHPPWTGSPSWGRNSDRYRLSPLGREHYERHWACYNELFPEIEAPEPPPSEDAHNGLADHTVKKPRGLLPLPPWRLLVELIRWHQAGTSPMRQVIEQQFRQREMAVPDLPDLPHGLVEWQIKKSVTTSTTAATRLVEYKAGPLAQYTDIASLRHYWWHCDNDEPLPLLHVTDAGLAHYTDHLATYRHLYPDVKTDVVAVGG